MPIDIDKLLAFQVPDCRQVVTAKDIAFYALSVGLGRDPLDMRQLAFVDPSRPAPMLPSMVLVLAHPGFWLAHPDSGVDPQAVLHAGQAFRIVDRLPREGEVRSRTRLTDVVDKGEGRPAILRTETELRDADDRLFATLDRSTFIRGGGGFGGGPGSPRQDAVSPDRPPDMTIDLETGREQALVYRLNGDPNPIHTDPLVARKAGFQAPILHGLCTMGIAAHALLRALADYRVESFRAMSLRFSGPVIPGETIRTEIWSDGRFRSIVPERGASVIEDGHVELDGLQNSVTGV